MVIYGNERFTEYQLETLESENYITEEERKYKSTLCEKLYKYKSDTKTPSLSVCGRLCVSIVFRYNKLTIVLTYFELFYSIYPSEIDSMAQR